MEVPSANHFNVLRYPCIHVLYGHGCLDAGHSGQRIIQDRSFEMNRSKQLLPRVRHVKAQDDFMLLVTFSDGAVKRFDVKPYLEYPAFRRLKDSALFFKAHVDHGTVVWDDMLDLSPDSLYLQGLSIETTTH
jgi:Protein of unknown function (DUF2442)